MTNLIGVSGRIGSGKNTVAMIIQTLIANSKKDEKSAKFIFRKDANQGDIKLLEIHSDWKQVSFAGKLKDIVCLLIGCTREQLESQEFKSSPLGKEWERWYYSFYKMKTNENNGRVSPYFDTKEECENYEFPKLFGKPIYNKEQLYLESEVLTPRLIMQLVGTNLFRNQLHPSIWVNGLFADIDKEFYIKPKTIVPKAIIGEITFLESLPNYKAKYKCYCGNEFISNIHKVRSGHTKSCGCYQKAKAAETQYKDGRKGSRLWNIYNNMIQRCENSNLDRYKDYGGRGITVSNKFKPFEKFKEWAESNGYTEELTLDRIDINDIYCPDNCRFVSNSIQAINTRDRKDNSSGFRGVSKDKHNWRASIQIDKKNKFLGYFNTPEEASIAYEKAFKEREDLYFNREIKSNKKSFIITDVRFPNEVEAIKERNGISIRVNRLLSEGNRPYVELHQSERSLDNSEFDYVIDNNSDIPHLIEEVRKMLIHFKII